MPEYVIRDQLELEMQECAERLAQGESEKDEAEIRRQERAWREELESALSEDVRVSMGTSKHGTKTAPWLRA